MDLDATKGLRLEVLHSSFRDALSMTENLDHVTLVGTVDTRPNIRRKLVEPLEGDERGPFTPSPDAPPVALVIRSLFGRFPHLYLSPVRWDASWERYVLPDDADGPWMASGAYAKGDSRWTRITAFYGYPFGLPIPLHDRHESWALYNSMSRD
jgi:hypothetical protein